MKFKLLLPTKVMIDEEVGKITAEAVNGSFTLLPRHIDFVAALVPGILSFEGDSGGENFVAVHEGVLVKQGSDVYVSVKDAIAGEQLDTLMDKVRQDFVELDEEEKKTRTALARIEAKFLQDFMQVNKL